MGQSKVILGIDDVAMWTSIRDGQLRLQRCDDCNVFRYPPAPVCPHCLCERATWTAVSGRGTILSWVVFHKQYFDDHPPPYNSVAVRLEEGPIIVTQLHGAEPPGSWIGQRVQLAYAEHAGRMQHHAVWVREAAASPQ